MIGTDVRQDIIETQVKLLNEELAPNARLHYFGRDTESGNARVILYTDGDAYGKLVAVGTPRECWQYLSGMLDALGITSN